MELMLTYNPSKRPSIDDILKHEYFANISQEYESQETAKVRKQSRNKPKTKGNDQLECMKITPTGIRIMTMNNHNSDDLNSLNTSGQKAARFKGGDGN